MRTAALATVGVALAAAVAGVARGAYPETTLPGVQRYAFVVITNTSMKLTNQGPVNPFGRGDVISFNVRNRSSRPQTFSLLGRTTRPIPPGKFTNTVFYNLNRRGTYAYRSTLSPKLRGTIIVE